MKSMLNFVEPREIPQGFVYFPCSIGIETNLAFRADRLPQCPNHLYFGLDIDTNFKVEDAKSLRNTLPRLSGNMIWRSLRAVEKIARTFADHAAK